MNFEKCEIEIQKNNNISSPFRSITGNKHVFQSILNVSAGTRNFVTIQPQTREDGKSE
jgi:hypothetical protein